MKLLAGSLAILVAGIVVGLPKPGVGPADAARGESCFFLPNGSRHWCVGPPTDDCFGWCWGTPCATIMRGTSRQQQWLFASEGNTDLGYARPVRQGYWKVSTAGGRSYLGSVERRSPTRWDIRDRRARLLGYATGPNPAVVGLFRLAADVCFR